MNSQFHKRIVNFPFPLLMTRAPQVWGICCSPSKLFPFPTSAGLEWKLTGHCLFLVDSISLSEYKSKLLVNMLLWVAARLSESWAEQDKILVIFHPFSMWWRHLLLYALYLSADVLPDLPDLLTNPLYSWASPWTNGCLQVKIMAFLVGINSSYKPVVKTAFFWEIMFQWKTGGGFVPHEMLLILMKLHPSRKLQKVKYDLRWKCQNKVFISKYCYAFSFILVWIFLYYFEVHHKYYLIGFVKNVSSYPVKCSQTEHVIYIFSNLLK